MFYKDTVPIHNIEFFRLKIMNCINEPVFIKSLSRINHLECEICVNDFFN